jgi:hypothetical protein
LPHLKAPLAAFESIAMGGLTDGLPDEIARMDP